MSESSVSLLNSTIETVLSNSELTEKQKMRKIIQAVELMSAEAEAASNPDGNPEPLLDPANEQYTVYPIRYPDIFDMYKKQQSMYWKAEEIKFERDYEDFCTLNENEQHFVKMILAFFAASDGIINANLAERFLNEVTVMEVKMLYSWQMMMENIHGEVYSLMLDNVVKDPVEREHLFKAIETVPAVKQMADWAFKWSESSESFAHRVVAFAIIEGVFFSGIFAAIFWLKKHKNNGTNFMDGLTGSNELISRDEGLHYTSACLVYSHIVNKLPQSEVYRIMDEGVELAKNFMIEAIPCRLINMNQDYMCDYIEYIGDRLLISLGYRKKYRKTLPETWGFMLTIGLDGKNNFFETRVTQYQDPHVAQGMTKRAAEHVKDAEITIKKKDTSIESVSVYESDDF